jgi:hypothetical protein
MYAYVPATYDCCKVTHVSSRFISKSLNILRAITTANKADEMVTCCVGNIVSSLCDIFTHM